MSSRHADARRYRRRRVYRFGTASLAGWVGRTATAAPPHGTISVPVAGRPTMLINFDLNSADLTGQAQANLNEFAKALKDERLQAATFIVEGYTDASGDERYNDRLSERRAEAVTAFLLTNGISRDKVQAVGKGEQNPRVPDPFDPINRRVEMRIKIQ